MKIQILQLIDGAKKAKGLTVVIDVFRAFSLECYMVHQGARLIIPVGEIEDAYRLKKDNPDYILVGERNERKPTGFDFGNSPTQILDVDFTGKTIIHTTSAGTQGLINASHASELITGSFVNANAVVNYIQKQKPVIVSLVCMGYSAKFPTEEDTFCAEYIKNCLQSKPTDLTKIMDIIRFSSGKRMFDTNNQEHSPETDFILCTEVGKFDFVLKATRNANGQIELKKIPC
jgi:2-phosphosulfolactate phosphatase